MGRRRILVSTVKGKFPAAGIRFFHAGHPSTANLHVRVGGSIRSRGVDSHVGGIGFCRILPFDRADLPVIALGDIADHVIGKVSAFLERGLIEHIPDAGPFRIVGSSIDGFPLYLASHCTGKPSGEKAAANGCASGRGCPAVSAATTMPMEGSGKAPACNEQLRHHVPAGVSYINPQGCHKAVDLLGNLEESNGTEEPDEHISGHGFLSLFCYGFLHLGFCQLCRKDRHGAEQNQAGNQYQGSEDWFFVFHGLLLSSE